MEKHTELQPIHGGDFAPPGPLSIEFYHWFCEYLDVSPRTAEAYRRHIGYFMEWLQREGITHPQRADIVAYRDNLTATGHKPTTVAAYLAALKHFFKWLRWQRFYPDITENVKSPKLSTSHSKDFLTPPQVRKVLAGIDRETLQGKRDYAVFLLCLSTGLRVIEVHRANIEDIGTAGGYPALFVQGKGRADKNEYVRLASQTELAIRDYLREREETNPTAPLFASTSNNSTGGRLSTRSISAIIKTAMQQAGFDSDRLTAHSLRHTAAVSNLDAGGTESETQALLRHTSPVTTQIYSRALDRAKNRSEQRLADLFTTEENQNGGK